MGNASTKERSFSPADGTQPPRRSSRSNGEPSSSSLHVGRMSTFGGVGASESYPGRSSRSRHNLEQTLLGLTVSNRDGRDREVERAARELRRKEREEERQRERARSRREESLDGGFLVTHGVYSGTEDFKDKIVRHLMIERRLAPFFKGLRDHEPDWSDAQLHAAFHGLPIPGPDAEPPKEEVPKVSARPLGSSDNLTVPMASRSRAQSYTSETSNRSNSSTPSFGFSTSRSRSKTLSISSPRNPTLTNVAGPTETNNQSRFVDGRPIEAVLYKDALECPICFMYYPPYLNRTRCCDQDICSECFVQIKRADPHVPENHDNNEPGETQPEPNSIADQLISEPATCPFCKQVDFGVTYAPPPWRRGLSYASQPGTSTMPPFSLGGNLSSTSLGDSNPSSQPASPPGSPSWKRRTMLPLNAPEVVTSDDIRPDWSTKLQTARSHAARRAAAATALHTAAFMMPSTSNENGSGSGSGSGSGPGPGPGGYGRRLIRRAVREGSGSGDRGGSESPSPNRSGSGTPRDDPRTGSLLALGTHGSRESEQERERGRERERERERIERDQALEDRLASLGFIPPRDTQRRDDGSGMLNVGGGRSERRSRVVDIEEMMLMEAIRLSLVEEEERKQREEAAAKEEMEAVKKAEKEAADTAAAAAAAASNAKGKDVDRSASPNSCASSSLGNGGSEYATPRTDDGENIGNADESMLSFRSLAEMIAAQEAQEAQEGVDKAPAVEVGQGGGEEKEEGGAK